MPASPSVSSSEGLALFSLYNVSHGGFDFVGALGLLRCAVLTFGVVLLLLEVVFVLF